MTSIGRILPVKSPRNLATCKGGSRACARSTPAKATSCSCAKRPRRAAGYAQQGGRREDRDRLTATCLALAVRKADEDLLEAITPAIDDANFDLMTKSQNDDHATLNDLIDSLRRLLEVQADANLLAGLLIEASLVTDVANLPPLRDSIAELSATSTAI